MGNPAGVRRDFQSLEQRRLLGARLLQQGVPRAEAWAASSGLRNQFVDLVARGPSDRRGMRSPLPCLASLAHSGAVGLELPASSGAGAGAGRRKDPAVEAEALAGD